MNVIVMSRGKAIEYCNNDHWCDDSVMISLFTPYIDYPNVPFCSYANCVKDILFISFCDADGVNDRDVYGHTVTEYDLFTDEQAKQIIDFVEKNKERKIIVHCDAGISRSSGVAAAILRHYTGSDDAIFNNRRYAPNMFVYYRLLKNYGDWGFLESDGEIEVEV